MHLSNLDPQHTQELVKGSAIDPILASLNFLSLEGNTPYEYLFISECVPRTNIGQVSLQWRRRYAQMTEGGWWCSGLDPLNNWQQMEWGCYKPNHPRQNANGKSIKYEHPPGMATRIFCLRVSCQIWQQAAGRYGIAMPEHVVISENGEAIGFWQWVLERKVPIIICEGAKKAAALLTQGYPAIALPGINSGYRVTRDWQGKVKSRQIIPDLAAFTQERTFYICFDYEKEEKKKRVVENAIAQLGYLIEQQGCQVKIIRLPGLEKGVDDFIATQGAAAFQTVYASSIDLETDLAKTKPHSELTYAPALILNQRYLGNLPFPKSGLVGIKSAKGTGKTTALENLVKQAKTQDIPVLLITHRIQLGKFLCDKIGVNWIGKNQTPTSITDYQLPITNYQSLGLCIDSIWKLNPKDWQGAIVILDEVEQSLWHLLNSDTCKHKRVKILKVFQQLIATVLQSGGLAIAQDADLSDISLDYLKGLAAIPIEPWVAINEWKPETGWDVTFYDLPNPTLLIHQLEQNLLAGKKCYITTDSRSGRYSPQTIDRYIKQRLDLFQQQYPKTLVVSSETTNTPGHEAVELIENINSKAKDYDAIFVTPSLGTGVSIDVEHFDCVYGIFQGVITDSEARQALARIRPNIPRMVWCAKRGIGTIGSGSKNYRVLSQWYQENQKENLALMSPIHKIDVDLPLVIDLIHLRNWAKFAAKVNASISLYRQSMLEGLIAEGHQVNIVGEAKPKQRLIELRHELLAAMPKNREKAKKILIEIFELQKQIKAKKQKTQLINHKIRALHKQIELNEAAAVANSIDINFREYEYLLAKRTLTDEERYQAHKYILQQRYGVEVTSELKMRDDRGYYWQILTHYYLIGDRDYFHLKDFQEWHQNLKLGEGKVFLPDLNTYTLKIEALTALKIPYLLDPYRQFKETDSDLVELRSKAINCSKHLKRALGIGVLQEPDKKPLSSIKILGTILKLLGLKLKRIRTLNPQGKQIKAYKIDATAFYDGRQEIFEIWQQTDGVISKKVDAAQFHIIESRGKLPSEPAMLVR